MKKNCRKMKYSLMIWAGQGGQLDIVSGHVKFYADIGKRLRKNLNLIKPRNLTEFARLKSSKLTRHRQHFPKFTLPSAKQLVQKRQSSVKLPPVWAECSTETTLF